MVDVEENSISSQSVSVGEPVTITVSEASSEVDEFVEGKDGAQNEGMEKYETPTYQCVLQY